jgi:hypothetical protein
VGSVVRFVRYVPVEYDIMSISDAGKLAQNTVKDLLTDSVPSAKRFGIGGKGEAS